MTTFNPRGDARSVDSPRAEYRVSASTSDMLPPVTLTVSTGVASTQDYLTPDEADALADALVRVAREVREATQ